MTFHLNIIYFMQIKQRQFEKKIYIYIVALIRIPLKEIFFQEAS